MPRKTRKKSTTAEGPMPWIGFEETTNTYKVYPEATKYLQTITGPIAVMSVVGCYRTGKSYLLNQIMGIKNAGFKVSPTIKSCTKGLWLMCPPLEMDGFHLLVVDTEGLGSLSASANHDIRVFSLALLLSSIFTYNATGAITENALNSVSLVAKIAQHVKLNSDDEVTDPASLAEHFPHFVWVARDFALQLVGDDNEPIDPTTYLNNALRIHGDIDAPKNRVRKAINALFPNRDCVCMVRPVTDENKLQHLDTLPNKELRTEFLDALTTLKGVITNIAAPMTHGDMVVTGPLLAELCHLYVNSINEGTVPAIKDSWSMLSESACRQAADKAREAWNRSNAWDDTDDQPVSSFMNILASLRDQIIGEYNKHAVGSAAGAVREALLSEFNSDMDRERALAHQRMVDRVRDRVRVLEKKAGREASSISAVVDIFEQDLETVEDEQAGAWYPEAFRALVRVIETMTLRLERKHHELQRKVDSADLEMSKLRSEYDTKIKNVESELQMASEKYESTIDAKETAERQFDDILRKYEERENAHNIALKDKDDCIQTLEEKFAATEHINRDNNETVKIEEHELKMREVDNLSRQNAELATSRDQALMDAKQAATELAEHVATIEAMTEQVVALLPLKGQLNQAHDQLATVQSEKDEIELEYERLEARHEEETAGINREAMNTVKAIREVLKRERDHATKAKTEGEETLRVLQEKASERAAHLEGQRDQAEELARQRRDQLEENKKSMSKERDHLRGEIDRYASMFKEAQRSNDESRRELMGQIQTSTRDHNDRERTLQADIRKIQQEYDDQVRGLEMEKITLTTKLESTGRRLTAAEREAETTRQKLGKNKSTGVELMQLQAEIKHLRESKEEATRGKKEGEMEIQSLRKKLKTMKRQCEMEKVRVSMQYEKQISILESRLITT